MSNAESGLDDRIPKHLKSSGAAWLASVLDDAGEEVTSTELTLLTLAAEALDRATTARNLVKREGITVRDRFQQVRAHPAVAIERDSRAAFARICAQLGLDGVEVEPQAYRGGNGRLYQPRKRS